MSCLKSTLPPIMVQWKMGPWKMSFFYIRVVFRVFQKTTKKYCTSQKQTHHDYNVATCKTCRFFCHAVRRAAPQPLPILKASRPPPRPPRYEGLPPRAERPLGFSKCLSSSSPEAFRKSSKSFIHGNTKFSFPALLAKSRYLWKCTGKNKKAVLGGGLR